MKWATKRQQVKGPEIRDKTYRWNAYTSSLFIKWRKAINCSWHRSIIVYSMRVAVQLAWSNERNVPSQGWLATMSLQCGWFQQHRQAAFSNPAVVVSELLRSYTVAVIDYSQCSRRLFIISRAVSFRASVIAPSPTCAIVSEIVETHSFEAHSFIRSPEICRTLRPWSRNLNLTETELAMFYAMASSDGQITITNQISNHSSNHESFSPSQIKSRITF